MYEHILVPTDGSEPATAALEYAAELAATDDASVSVVTVSDGSDPGAGVVAAACDRIADAGGAAEGAVLDGTPHEVILEAASERAVDAIVMGTRGRQGVGRFVLGSVAERVVRDADVPVFAVRDDEDVRLGYPPETVLVPVDGSEHASRALEAGLGLARAHDATVHLLSAVDTRPTGVDVGSSPNVDAVAASARTIVEEAETVATEAGFDDVATMVTFGSAHREIPAYAAENDVDLVVMGTHGRSGVDRFLLGSVTERVLRTAPAPVLTVRGPESDASR
ncbi:universal stress protein [Natronobeatus ordinarius]|uniref:universal stress protein n=1 Tax=Natronobeatus ordinarius TaxID=2963433 RepID=UPI0020CD5387|nr:universal stress protein [Natronobeatus ordinarius]